MSMRGPRALLALAVCVALDAAAQSTRAGVTLVPDSDGTETATPGSVSTLTIDTRNTGVDLGLHRNADGSLSTRVPASRTRRPALDNGAALGTSGPTATPPAGGAAMGSDLGGANDPLSNGTPGISALGDPTSAGRVNGNSAADNGRNPTSSSAGTTLRDSAAPGNGADGTTRAGPAANGAASGNGTATGRGTRNGSIDAATAASAAAQSRTENGTAVSGRILMAPRGAAAGATST